MKLTQNQYYGLRIDLPHSLGAGSIYLSQDTKEFFVYGEDGLPTQLSAGGPAGISQAQLDAAIASVIPGTAITVVANYSALPDPTTVSNKFYFVDAAQGTKWLPGELGGTYYPKGMYHSSGSAWIYLDSPYQGTQIDVDAGLLNDRFITPLTLSAYSKWATKADASTVQLQLNGTGLVRMTGTTVSYDNSTYLTAITGANVITALGFTPYDSTNPSGYITAVPAQTFASLTGKPTTIGGYGITDFNSLGDARWSLSAHTHTFTSLTGKPTTLTGYGITDAYPLSGNPSGFISAYTETDPVVRAINGIVKSNGTIIAAAVAGTDYVIPSGNVATATNLVGLTTLISTLNNQSGTNSGDNATNTQYSGLAASKQNNITLTTTGTTGNATLVGSTLNIPNYAAGAGVGTNLSWAPTATSGTLSSDTGTDVTIALGNGTLAGLSLYDFSDSLSNKLIGMQDEATKNDTDANLRARAGHTGTQLAATISDFNQSADTRVAAGITGKVNANGAIVGATNTKITYDAKGLVTAGTTLVSGDIPNIAQSQVTNLTTDLTGKQATLSLTTTGTSGAATLVGATLNIPNYAGGGGATNLTWTPSATTGTVFSDTGTDAVINVAGGTNAGLMTPTHFNKVEAIITGYLELITATDNTSQITLKFPAGSNADRTGILFKGNDGTFNKDFAELVGGVESWSADDGYLGFRSSKAGVLSEKARVTANGNFLINSTTDNNVDRLQVIGSVIATTLKKSGGTASQFLKADGTVDTTAYLSGTVPVANGGTGAVTNTGVLIGAGTAPVISVVGAASQYLRRNAGDTAYEFATLAGGGDATVAGALQQFPISASALFNRDGIPASPTGLGVKMFVKDIAARALDSIVDSSGIITHTQSSLSYTNYSVLRPGATTVPVTIGRPFTFLATVSHPAPSGTTLKTSMNRFASTSAATAGAITGPRVNTLECWRGSVAGLGGFFVVGTISLTTLQAGMRAFMGLSNTAPTAPTNVDPTTSTTSSTIGLAINTNTGNWNLVHTNAGTAPTVVALGVSYPVNALDVLELTLYAPPNAAVVNYRVRNLTSGVEVTGILSTNLPANTTFLGRTAWATNNATAAAVSFDIGVFSCETQY
jgi:hypothetical protein